MSIKTKLPVITHSLSSHGTEYSQLIFVRDFLKAVFYCNSRHRILPTKLISRGFSHTYLIFRNIS